MLLMNLGLATFGGVGFLRVGSQVLLEDLLLLESHYYNRDLIEATIFLLFFRTHVQD